MVASELYSPTQCTTFGATEGDFWYYSAVMSYPDGSLESVTPMAVGESEMIELGTAQR